MTTPNDEALSVAKVSSEDVGSGARRSVPEAAHTPTPWEVTTINGRPAICHNGHALASMRQYGTGWGKPLVNARFIVTACNSHDELVAALKPFAEFARVYLSRPSPNMPTEGTMYAIERASGSAAITVEMLKAALAILAKVSAQSDHLDDVSRPLRVPGGDHR